MLLIALLVLLGSAAFSTASDQWQPANGPLMTRWAADVSPDNALPEYPRPQMVREDWQNLNGLWDYAIRPTRATATRRRWTARFSCRFRSSRRCRA